MTVRKWLDSHKQEAYEAAIAATVDHIVGKKNFSVVFIPQVTSSLGGDDDRLTARRIYKRVANNINVHLLEDDLNHYQIKALYNELNYIIGTRFHSVIFSLTSLVPAIAIEYEHKTRGIMHDLKLDEWVIKIENVSNKNLPALFEKLLKNELIYKNSLTTSVPKYVQEAKQATALMVEAYDKSIDITA